MNIHSGSHTTCKYFAEKNHCPFEHVGCMFGHETVADHATADAALSEDSEMTLIENQCHLCMKIMATDNEFMEHFNDVHKQFYTNMMKNIYN